MSKTRPKSPLPKLPMEGVDESTWMDVIQKMDEVYTRLIDDEVALENKNTELQQSQQFIFSVLSSMSDVLVVCDANGVIEQANAALCELTGRPEEQLRGTPLYALLADEPSRALAREDTASSTRSAPCSASASDSAPSDAAPVTPMASTMPSSLARAIEADERPTPTMSRTAPALRSARANEPPISPTPKITTLFSITRPMLSSALQQRLHSLPAGRSRYAAIAAGRSYRPGAQSRPASATPG